MSFTNATTHIQLNPCWRIIPNRFPSKSLLKRVADPSDYDAIFALKSKTNPRLRIESGDISLLPPNKRISCPGTSIIIAAFTHHNPDGNRFSDGSYGVFYAAKDLDTAIAETKYHRECFLRATTQPPMEIGMRVYLFDLDGILRDIRGHKTLYPLVYHNTNYGAEQHLAKTLGLNGSKGIAYDRVRHIGGECAAVFCPHLLSKTKPECHFCYVWDGTKIDAVYKKSSLRSGGVQ